MGFNASMRLMLLHRNGEKLIINKPAGHLLRTKTASSNEGGVAAGYGVIDSPYLTQS